MRVLVACEWSGRVRDAFCRRGIEAYSCDIQHTYGEYRENHYRCDVRDLLEDTFIEKWDMMIAFPPCTFLAATGAGMDARRARGQREGLEFVRYLMNAPIEHIAIENPVGVISTQIRKPDQYIQPYQFGDPFQKKTCLWLKNLPPLMTTKWCRAEAMPWVDSGRLDREFAGVRNPKTRGHDL